MKEEDNTTQSTDEKVESAVADKIPDDENKEQDMPGEVDKVEVVEVAKAKIDNVRSGQTVRLHIRISEGKKDRIQIFEGIVLGISGSTPVTKTITVRKVSKGYGVEKVIPLAMPALEKIEVVKEAKIRRSKLYFLRNYKKRLRERKIINN
ncbi:MAG: 50S ribosomal protein L19 [bacterium]|nr:50S ribosomal protein L19 [bacterium]